jgi:putative membrane protein
VIRGLLLAIGSATLALVWLGPLPRLAPQYFSAHMTMHMGVVAVGAPLLALGLAGGRFDPARRLPVLFSAIPAAVLELVVVWAWHAPALHHLARGSAAGLIAEQSMFFASGFLVWMSAFGGDLVRSGHRAGTGVVALLLTSMHMTLLGSLIALSPRSLYVHDMTSDAARTLLQEQHLGGAIMLLVGGIAYLAGGLVLSAVLLTRRSSDARVRTAPWRPA